jgi:hypothetical protein
MCSIGEQNKIDSNVLDVGIAMRNESGWLINPAEENGFIKLPAFWNEGKVNVSYIDGSTGSIKLESDTLEKEELRGHDSGDQVIVPGASMEYKQFKKIMLPGVIGSILDE